MPLDIVFATYILPLKAQCLSCLSLAVCMLDYAPSSTMTCNFITFKGIFMYFWFTIVNVTHQIHTWMIIIICKFNIYIYCRVFSSYTCHCVWSKDSLCVLTTLWAIMENRAMPYWLVLDWRLHDYPNFKNSCGILLYILNLS